MGSFIKTESRSNHVAILKVERADALNALNTAVLDELAQEVRTLKDNQDLRALIVTGGGRAFVAGADIKAMQGFTTEQAQAFAEKGHVAFDAIAHLPFPVLAAVNGFALGGGLELALSCDLIYASERAKLGLPEVGLGLIPGFGGTQRLGRLIGYHAAREMIFTGDHLNAHEALQLGLVRRVFPPEDLLEEVIAIAERIAAQGPAAVRTAKRVLREGRHLPLSEANRLEIAAFASLMNSDEPQQGMAAFIEKRSPEWR